MNEKITNGYYWAKTSGYKWFNAVIHVYGDTPFCKIEGYDFSNNKEVKDISAIDEFGARIPEPK